MKNLIKRIIFWIALICLGATLFLPAWFWLTNSELTQMQVLFKVWWDILIMICLFIIVTVTKDEY